MIIPCYYLHNVIGKNNIRTNFDSCCLPDKIVPFYKNAFKIWSDFVSYKPVTPAEVLVQPLWCNIYIKVNKQSIYYSHLSRIGINFIKDVVNYKGHLKSPREILSGDKYNKFVMSINALLQAIPKKWLQIIYNNVDRDLLNS